MGLLDEDFFAYIEDNEISLRSAQFGFKNIVVPEATVFHSFNYENAPPYHFYYMARNLILLINKHGKFPKKLKSILWAINEQAKKLSKFHHNLQAKQAIYAGVWDGLCGNGGQYYPKRPKEVFGRLVFVISNIILKFR